MVFEYELIKRSSERATPAILNSGTLIAPNTEIAIAQARRVIAHARTLKSDGPNLVRVLDVGRTEIWQSEPYAV
jgi:hypothetical protein